MSKGQHLKERLERKGSGHDTPTKRERDGKKKKHNKMTGKEGRTEGMKEAWRREGRKEEKHNKDKATVVREKRKGHGGTPDKEEYSETGLTFTGCQNQLELLTLSSSGAGAVIPPERLKVRLMILWNSKMRITTSHKCHTFQPSCNNPKTCSMHVTL